MGALPFTIPSPTVKRALNAVAHDFGTLARVLSYAITQMSTHVRTEGVYHPCLSIFSTKRDELLTKVMQGQRVARCQVRGVKYLKPAEGHGEMASN